MPSLAEASVARQEGLLFAEMDKRLDLLLANLTHGENPGDHYHAVTANPRSMGYLRFLLKHYARDPHPWTACYRDNFKRFGPKAKGLCGVLKDTIRQSASWRGHPGLDHGAPGVAIGEADKGAAPAWGGHGHGLSEDRPLSLLDALDLEFGVVDHSAAVAEAADVFCVIGAKCDVYRVLLGLDEPPLLYLDDPRPPPNLRVSDDAKKECGNCEMHTAADLCWGYGNIPTQGDWLCDAWDEGSQIT